MAMSHVELPDPVPSFWPRGMGALRSNADVAAAITAFVDQCPFGVAVIDPELRFLLVSQGLATIHGRQAADTVGKRVDEVLPPRFSRSVVPRLREILRSGVPMVDAETWGTFKDQARSFTSSFYRLDGAEGVPYGVVVLVTETTDLRQAEIDSRSTAAQLHLLQRVTEVLSGGSAIGDVAAVAVEGAAQSVGASAATIMTLDDKEEGLALLATTGLVDATLERLRHPAALTERLPHCDAVRSQTMILLGSRPERDADYPDLAGCPGEHQAWAFVPLVARGRNIGVVMFAWRLDHQFEEVGIALLAGVGRQCSVALDQARVIDAEREARRATEFLAEVTRFVVEGSDAGVFAISNSHRILTFNRRFCEIMGLPDQSVQLGTKAGRLLAPCLALVADPEAVDRHLVATQERPTEEFAAEFALKDGRILSGKSSPILDRQGNVLGRVWYVRDETRRLVQEAEQQHALDQLAASHEHQAFLLQASDIVAQGVGYRDTLERLAAVAVPVLADLCLVDALTVDGRVLRMAARHADPVLQPLAEALATRFAPDRDGSHPSVEAMRTGRAQWSATMSDDFLQRTTRDDDHFRITKQLGFASYMSLPLVADNQILGSITLVSSGSGRRFGHEDLALAGDFTACVAQVVAAAHRNDAARHAAHTLQASLLPDHVPDVKGLVLATRYLPATVDNDVGGDFYDVMQSPSGTATIAIGDVAGHDMEAAAVMGKVRTAARVLAGQATGARHLIEMLRRGWDNLELERMATLLIAHVDPYQGGLRIVSAGHPPPLLVRDGEGRFLDVKPTTPLGAPRSPIREWRGTLSPGELLLLYTDGLVEGRDRDFDAGAAALLRASGGDPCSPNEFCDRVLDALVPDEAHHDDDIAMVSLALDRIG
jgi:serine phosphatase RsbU (regulator of sigma subunit)/PAS domain-containing protein